jgi:CheY-like chemotaxis protein
VKSKNTVLIVEDNEDDRILLSRAFKFAGIDNPVQVVEDGQEAVDYLRGGGKYSDRTVFPLPDVVLMDIKLPRLSGFEVLQSVRCVHELKGLIIIVITSSNQPSDIYRAYDSGANAYMIKPGNFADLLTFAKAFKAYWLQLNNAVTPAPEAMQRGG